MNIVIVDDHPLVRKGLISILDTESNIEDIYEAENVKEALKTIRDRNPDLVLVDLKLGNENGLEIIKECKKNHIKSKFIVLTSSANLEDFLMCEKIGIDGYILKEAFTEELLYGIKIVIKGRKYYDPVLLEYKIKYEENNFTNKLTPREHEVLEALGRGLTNRQIAKELFITEYTVKKHVSQILAKLDLRDRTQAALYANKKRIVNN